MVAGMVMSLADLRSIYELLFRDGVIVAKKDKRPQSMHPDIKVVSNLKVICAMGSLKSKGYVRETFAWKHAYYYLTNEGTVYLRDYLHLPPGIKPAPLQRLHCLAASSQVQTVKGPSSYITKSKPGRIHPQALDGGIYDDNRVEKQGEKSARALTNSVGKDEVQKLTFNRKDKDFCRGDERGGKKGHKKSSAASCLPAEKRSAGSSISLMDSKLPASFVHNSPSVVLEMPKEMSAVQTVPFTPVKEVLQKRLKVTAAEQSPDFEKSECVQMHEAVIKNAKDNFVPAVAEGKAVNPTIRVPREVEHVLPNCQSVPLLTDLTIKQEQQGVLEEDDVVIEDTVEKPSDAAAMMEQLNNTNSKTCESDHDHDSATHPLTAKHSFKDLTKDRTVDYGIADVEDRQKILEETVFTQVISQLHVASETTFGAAFEADCPIPTDPSQCLTAAPKSSLLQGNIDSLTDVPDKEQDVHRIWPDFQEGLSFSLSPSPPPPFPPLWVLLLALL